MARGATQSQGDYCCFDYRADCVFDLPCYQLEQTVAEHLCGFVGAERNCRASHYRAERAKRLQADLALFGATLPDFGRTFIPFYKLSGVEADCFKAF